LTKYSGPAIWYNHLIANYNQTTKFLDSINPYKYLEARNKLRMQRMNQKKQEFLEKEAEDNLKGFILANQLKDKYEQNMRDIQNKDEETKNHQDDENKTKKKKKKKKNKLTKGEDEINTNELEPSPKKKTKGKKKKKVL